MTKHRLTFGELSEGLAFKVDDTHVITLLATRRVRLVGMFFDLNKCFLLPSAMHGIKEIKSLYDQHPKSNLLVVGHTDTSGKDDYNLALSLERAAAVAAFLTDDADAWLKFFDNPAAEKKWGLREVQAMLSALPEGGPFFFKGKPTGVMDSATKQAIRDFQTDNGLTVDGIAGPETRKALVKAYMGLDDTSLPQGTTLTTHGCGENFPVDGTQDGKRDPDNRRVEIFFFDGPITPAPAGKTSGKDATDYPEWLKQVTHNIDVVLGQDSAVAGLTSRYALERFELLTDNMEEDAFAAWGTVSFGSDVPVEAYRKLYQDLKGRKLDPPDVQLVPGGIDGEDSGYDNATRMIGMAEELALAAPDDDASCGKLCALLMHEFGHHVDNLLRKHYSGVGGDAPGEEGGLFAYAITAVTHLEESEFVFATLNQAGVETELKISYDDFKDAAEQYVNDPQQQIEAKRETVEFFSAGRGPKNKQFPNDSYGHQSIEDGLGDADPVFFSNDPATRIRDQIYFGNWLRDYSQFLDPIWLQAFENPVVHKGKQARQVMTNYLDLMAKSEFDSTAAPGVHEAGVFHVTVANCGVYRAQEHIDNPLGITNGAAIDPLFHGPVPPNEIAIDPATGLKNYIATPGPGYATAIEFAEKSFRDALKQGFNPEGRRLFGQGLHTCEDLYAHSNFVELSLIRLGHTSVFPWVGERTQLTVIRNGKPDTRFPMVTGTFGSVDTVVSAVSAIGESLQEKTVCEAGVFSKKSVVGIELVKLLTDDGGKALESLFARVKKLEAKYPEFTELLCRTTAPLLDKLSAVLGSMMRAQVTRVDQYEKAVVNDPTQTAPSHSMLAKDHDDHPLHAIAAQCAREAVKQIGAVMRDAWNGVKSPDDVIALMKQFFVHPNDIDVVASTAASPILAKIKAFGDTHPAVILQLNRANSVARFLRQAKEEHAEAFKTAKDMYAQDDTNADRIMVLMKLETA
ncbi:MAG: peptidoglycan-binding protein [Fibrobacteres bacterium]|nr:peptidoglycan-binding protein [Fibrobacterota bacterium]